ncbi:YjcZ family sporulation protein [Bacillaceae bacterium IKA-2]|nr:YjcZ family sporulation protein [Bacillaceae bacterium IKA-2]
MYGHGYGASANASASAFGYGGCGYPVAPVAPVAHHGAGRGFALIVVLFILLVIIGASWAKPVC